MLKFGEIVVDEGYATDEQIETALEYQKNTDIVLGTVLVGTHKMTHADAERVTDFLNGPEGTGKTFGDVAIFMGYCTEDDVKRGQQVQKESKGMLGHLLVALGYITEEQRESILKIQFPGS